MFKQYRTLTFNQLFVNASKEGRRDRMIVGFATIYAISAYHH